ncbi:P-loop containing nucleoside triphosphate hydrolase protein [Sistotremastrum niveocremeum HHB9708]|uniref:p-loop containing nucleoside triphosphate hydrolase protein n=1 Tax=Sistotremastrum niveocremeum HHB9708 TaxID=1314777 RepID=A0A164Y340_9AGAM|nr:P-loop containing nucleoside triphosphate hydrolase protein [Sistotremastrum niveocremeum HHB9708]
MSRTVFEDVRCIPLYTSFLSVILLVLHSFVPHTRLKKYYARVVDLTYDAKFRDDPIFRESFLTRLLQSIRLLCCLALVALSASLLVTSSRTDRDVDIVLLSFFIYSTIISFVSVGGSKKWRSITSAHLSFSHLVAFGVYVARDLAPLALARESADSSEGAVGWARFILLGVTGFLIPGILPHKYYPVDPENPSEPAPHQTASYVTWAFFDFLDPVVYRAFRSSTLTFDELPVLADDDQSKYLARTSFAVVDPVTRGGKRNLVWGFLVYFRKQYFIMFIAAVLQSINEFALPIATNRILAYLEPGGQVDSIKPWVWILWLGTGPIIGSICFQIYLYVQTQTLVRLQAILTQIILIHSMRVRLATTIVVDPKDAAAAKASASSAPTPAPASAVVSETNTPAMETVSLPDQETESVDNDTTIRGSESTTTLLPSSSSAKSTGDGTKKDGTEGKPEKKEAEKSEDYIGKINNFLTTDSHQLLIGQDWMQPGLVAIRIGMCMAFLYLILGWSALVGMGAMVIFLPIPGYIGKLMIKFQKDKMKKVYPLTTAVMNVIRMIKLFAWESKVEEQIAEKRNEELKYHLRNEMTEIATWSLNAFFPAVTMISTYATYPSRVTSKVTYRPLKVFNSFEGHLQRLFFFLPGILRAKVSIDRIGAFLNSGELYSETTAAAALASETAPIDKSSVLIRDAVFTWDKIGSSSGTATPSRRRNFKLQIDGDLTFKPGVVNLICGPTASGKTSLLMALLGEMYFQPSLPTGTYNLPRDGGVAYAAQETWVLNETIRENILFGSAYDKERFDKVVYQCGLKRDLSLFDAGDMTEVGEKGITLSGGQKARITLARAVYSQAQVVLLDDVLSALDVHTAQWVAQKCLGGDILEGRTVLLVTHNVLLCEPIADYVISIGQDGKIVSKGTISDALKKNAKLREEVKAEEKAEVEAKVDAVADADETADPGAEAPAEEKKDSGKLIVAEEMAVGHVSWDAAKLYGGQMGGPIFFALIMLALFVEGLTAVFQKWFLGYWSSRYEIRPPVPIPIELYLGIYSSFYFVELLFGTVIQMVFILGAIRASRSLHAKLVKSVLNATLRWLDTVPISRVISRCSQDCLTIDSGLPGMLIGILFLTTRLFLYFIGVIVSAGWPSLIPGVFVAVSGVICGQIYIKAQLPVKRHMSNLKSPVLSHVGAALHGLVSIRAYGAQGAFEAESLRRIDRFSRAARTQWNFNRWIAVRMDTLGAVFSGIVAAYLVYGRDLNSGSVGFTLSLISAFSSMLLGWVRVLNEVEVPGNSVERIRDFLLIDHEPEPQESGKTPAYWPSTGELHVEKLSARYSADSPEVLKNISFSLSPGQRMGIVGRTGAGKSTVALALLRAIPTTGSVIYDGIDIAQINLNILRSNITIIPQHPELLAGNLRDNLDPFSEHDDATLNDALRAAGLYHTQSDDAEGGITLDTDVQSGGSNFSQGQRQIVALARAILRRSKIVILDEATAAIDYATDHAIQESLRTEFKEATVITVAHRLQTIMQSDKIIVLDTGSAVELDSPKALLQKEGSFFKSLVDESSDKEALYKAAGL